MNELLLPATVRFQTASSGLADRVRTAWVDRAEEDGVDEAVTKMIWLAVGVAVAVAATAFFINVFDSAKSGVPDPVAPTP